MAQVTATIDAAAATVYDALREPSNATNNDKASEVVDYINSKQFSAEAMQSSELTGLEVDSAQVRDADSTTTAEL